MVSELEVACRHDIDPLQTGNCNASSKYLLRVRALALKSQKNPVEQAELCRKFFFYVKKRKMIPFTQWSY